MNDQRSGLYFSPIIQTPTKVGRFFSLCQYASTMLLVPDLLRL